LQAITLISFQNVVARQDSKCAFVLLKQPYFTAPLEDCHIMKRRFFLTLLIIYLADKIIRPSNSPYASAVVLVKKKDGNIRMCVDYRGLNKKTVRDDFPLPLIEDCLEYLEGKSVFSVIDPKSGFHHIGVEEESVKYTSFVTPDGQFEYLRMPFGLNNGPAVFQRFISHVLSELVRNRQIVVYMDDIILASNTVDEHQKVLATLLNILVKFSLEINFK